MTGNWFSEEILAGCNRTLIVSKPGIVVTSFIQRQLISNKMPFRHFVGTPLTVMNGGNVHTG